jgi:diaminopimelate decarboxylase
VAARKLTGLMAAVRAEHGVTLPELNIGGGHGIPCTEDDLEFDLAGFARRVPAAVRGACASLRLPVPRLTVEPGRAIIGRAMVTLYRVVSIKHGAGPRTFVAVDGGMSDNPRPALYGARYSVRGEQAHGRMSPAVRAGPRERVRRAGAAHRPAALRAAGRAGLHLGGGVAVGAGPRPALDPAPRRRYA